ncbi:MAG: long-chain fatty acid--CoA ligase [Myxococcota bacterium]
MMDFPLSITHLLERGRAISGGVEVVTRRPDKSVLRQTYADTYRRAEALGRGLHALGLKPGERVGTLCWNHREHLEAYLGIPAAGMVVHTLNLRLHPDELAFIVNDAADAAVIVDRSLWPLWQKFADRVPSVRRVIVVRDDHGPVPDGAIDHEAVLAGHHPLARGPGMAQPVGTPFAYGDERAAAMICYTSGTTGHPKGVVYTHRSTVLHALATGMRDAIGIGCDDVVLPVVPMFHAAAWGLPYGAFATGAKIVFPGPHLDPVSLLDLMVSEKVTIAGGVPTIWLGILAELDKAPDRWDLSAVRTMVIGGSAAPPSLIKGFQERHGLEVTHAWGMTETNPLGTLARPTPAVRARGEAAVFEARASQGTPVPFVEIRHVDDVGTALPWDGETMGELEVRGPWVAGSYLGDQGPDRFTADGWFKTGDVVTIDADGYVRITDRSKDVIKSGGEWISSVALENALMAHPAVLEAAVFAVPHPKWDERPVAAIVVKAGHSVDDAALLAHLDGKFARFWLPEAFVYLVQIPRTSTGKFLKSALRSAHAGLLSG